VLVSRGASVKFEHVDFRYSDSQRIFADLNLHFRPGEPSAWSAIPTAANRPCSRCCSASTIRKADASCSTARISRVTQDSLREAIGVVPQDILFHRSVMDNIRYGKPEASDDEVMEAAITGALRFRGGEEAWSGQISRRLG
jgi:ATP-binding cassette subfamily B protein